MCLVQAAVLLVSEEQNFRILAIRTRVRTAYGKVWLVLEAQEGVNLSP